MLMKTRASDESSRVKADTPNSERRTQEPRLSAAGPIRVHSRSFAVSNCIDTALVDVRKNESQKVSQILVGQSFFEPFWHERCALGLNLCDPRARNDHLVAESLSNGDAAGGFVHDETSVAVPFPGIEEVGEVVRRHFAVGIENIDQQLLFPSVLHARQIRSDRESLAAEAVTGLTALQEQGLAAIGVSS